MSEDILHSPAGTLIKTTLVDFPHRVSATVFLEGCNLRCPYCYNGELVLGETAPNCRNGKRNYPVVSLEEILEHIHKRQGLLSGITVSGGEPLLNKRTEIIIREAKKCGYKIKIDTNGTLPDLLQDLINDEELKPDYIAMDLKTNPAHYSLLMEKQSASADEDLEHKLLRSIKIITSSFAPENREWRTVLVPALVKAEDINAIAAVLPKDAQWYLAQFRNENCMNPEYEKIDPYLDKDINVLLEAAKAIIPGAELR